jgi:chromodomain-helicase-DNA-binding protein 1
MPFSTGHTGLTPLTNGHTTPLPLTTAPGDHSPHSDSDLSDDRDAVAVRPLSDEDAPGEDYNQDEEMGIEPESSEDEDAEGEPDGDYDSETLPPAEQDALRSRSSSSQESQRPLKRKAGAEEDDYMTQNPELYGLRRSVRSPCFARLSPLTVLRDVPGLVVAS